MSIAATKSALLARLNSSGKLAKPWPCEFVWDFGELRVLHRTRRVPALLIRRAADPASWQTVRRALLNRPPSRTRLLLATSCSASAPSDVPSGNVFVSLYDVVPNDGSLAIDPEALLAQLDRWPTSMPDGPLVIIADGREVRLHDQVFRFPRGVHQRRIIRALHQHYLSGERKVSSVALIAELDLRPNARLRDFFKKDQSFGVGTFAC